MRFRHDSHQTPLRFSLRFVLAMVLLFAMAAGVVSYCREARLAHQREQRIIARLYALDAIMYGPRQAVLRTQRVALMERVTRVAWWKKATDELFDHLSEFQQLESFKLCGMGVEDHSMVLISSEPWGRVTSRLETSQLQRIGGLSNLNQLELCRFVIADGAIQQLATLKRLEKLSLIGVTVRDSDLEELQDSLPVCKISR